MTQEDRNAPFTLSSPFNRPGCSFAHLNGSDFPPGGPLGQVGGDAPRWSRTGRFGHIGICRNRSSWSATTAARPRRNCCSAGVEGRNRRCRVQTSDGPDRNPAAV